MRYVKVDPPGTFCIKEALRDALRTRSGRTFLDIGCGGGGMSRLLCDAGWTGIGVDFSQQALAIARQELAPFIEAGSYRLHEGDVHDLSADLDRVDLAISYMVMEHIEDDVGFVRKLCGLVKPGGSVVLGVPGRRDRWSLEDETVGHFRRYDRADLETVLRDAGLQQVDIWSIGVPVANLLFNLSVRLIARSSEQEKIGQSQREQTETSGIREIPWKTVFPAWVRILLNRTTLSPLFVLQRLFYRTGLGITMMGMGRVPSRSGAVLAGADELRDRAGGGMPKAEQFAHGGVGGEVVP